MHYDEQTRLTIRRLIFSNELYLQRNLFFRCKIFKVVAKTYIVARISLQKLKITCPSNKIENEKLKVEFYF